MSTAASIFSLFLLFSIFDGTNAAPSKALTKSAKCPVKLPQDNPQLVRLTSITHNNVLRNTNESSSQRIVNGDIISQKLLPYMVVTVPFMCTGALISPTWFVTAAHCELDPRLGVAIGVPRAGSYNVTNFRRIVRSFNHPSFSGIFSSGTYDFAVHEIYPAAPQGSKYLRVAVDLQLPMPDTYVRVMGYGDIESFVDGGGICRQVDVPVTTIEYCNRVYANINETGQFCAGYKAGGCDSCQGDSGGPVIQYDSEDEPVLVGLVSAGAGCADPESPGIYVRAASFESYLDQIGVSYTKALGVKTVSTRTLNGRGIGIIVGITLAVLVLLTAPPLYWFVFRKHCCARNGNGNSTDSKAPANKVLLGTETTSSSALMIPEADHEASPVSPETEKNGLKETDTLREIDSSGENTASS